MKRDLAYAGIDYGNQQIGYADLHSLRMTLNNMLAENSVATRTRQSQLRHADPKLTEVSYFDRSRYLQPQAAELNRVEGISSPVAADPTVKMGEDVAQNMHKTRDRTSYSGAPQVMNPQTVCEEQLLEGGTEKPRFPPENGTKRRDPAPSGTGSSSKRAKGFEPSTFTLGT